MACIIAYLILMSPDEPNSLFVGYRPMIQQVSLQLEILDPRERKYILSRDEDFECDIKLVRSRYKELHDAPMLYDSIRFVDRATVNEMLAFNRAYRQNLEAQTALDKQFYWEYRAVIQKVDDRYRVWDLVRDARCEYFYITVRRQALKKLKEELGDERFYSASMPAHVPLEHFSRAD